MSAHPLPTAVTRRDGEATYPAGATRSLTLLSRLLFSRRNEPDQSRLENPSGVLNSQPGSSQPEDLKPEDLHPEELPDLLALADAHHVVIRGLQPFEQMVSAAGKRELAAWAAQAVRKERARIGDAIYFLSEICDTLQAECLNTMVIKSLDHWPDLGSDLDLFTSAPAADVIQVMKSHFRASLAARSWGDRLANKWNFIVPGLRELVEVHVGRLGQTGEHVALARSLIRRGRSLPFESYSFRVPAPEERVILSTLQRMYRHFYLRLCDVADTAQLVENDTVDYEFLRAIAQTAGIWEGAATFLTVVSDYLERFRGSGLSLPDFVVSAAQFRGDQLTFQRFLRIPIMPHAVRLYASQLRRLVLNGEVAGTLRLSLLPCLATAAVVEQRITGSDKGIW